ncbi:P-loop containing nucleoside triphosphate hydrolase protein [Mycena pura]|uniref:Origin recognition complex subunit 1 n=1 Tax=Mycena pura TaxID=153505 RepID=A0AAD6UXL1_9AGAR|nr:P-loop containing nucleoside triphosphate hydrolase protein [Mycena pura]
MRGTPKTPLRRSTRGQPLAALSTKLSGSPANIKWHGQMVHERLMIPELDMLPERRTTWAEQDEKERPKYRAVFYNAFQKTERGESIVFNVGDTVTVETMVLHRDRKASIAVIVAMWELVSDREGAEEDEDEEDENVGQMMVRIHWFLRPSELATIRAKREHLDNEIYYSLSSDAIFGAASMVSHCQVVDNAPHSTPMTTPRRRWVYDDEKKNIFCCRLAVDSRRGVYYDFNWTGHHKKAFGGADEPWGSGDLWNVDPVERREGMPPRKKLKPTEAKQTRSKRKRIEIAEEGPDDSEYDQLASDSDADNEYADQLPTFDGDASDSPAPDTDSDTDIDAPKTPSKSRKRRRTAAHPTPHSKAALARRRVKGAGAGSPRKRTGPRFRLHNAGLGYETMSNLPKDPWLRAMQMLHVGSRPDALPCRDDEFDRVLGAVYDLLEEGSGGCVYISGVPGTGKTATVHAVVRELKRMAESTETNPFTYVEINGLRIPEPTAAYSLLWEVVSGHNVAKEGHLRMGAKESLKALTAHFSGGSSRGPGGHACVVLMDELDQLMTAKQDVVYNFFNWPTLAGSKLVVLAVANTMDLPERAMTGRVRSRLGMTRINFPPYTAAQLQAIVEARVASAREGQPESTPEVLDSDAIKLASKRTSNTSGDARRILDICRRAVELAHQEQRKAVINDVLQVTKQMQNSPTAAYLRQCSFHERLILVALIKCIKSEGVEEIKWGDVAYQHSLYVKVFEDPDVPRLRQPTPNELVLVLDSLVASQAVLLESGAAAMRKAAGDRKVVLNLEQSEVERVLGEVGGDKWRNNLTS